MVYMRVIIKTHRFMSNLFILNETYTNGLNYNILYVISVLSVLSGILVIISKNPIVSVLFLIGLFLNIAGYLMMLGINFIGLSYLLVYVGAVSILFLFILMLINVRISELVTDNNNSVPLAAIIGIIFNLTLFNLLPSNFVAKGYIYNLGLNKIFTNMDETNNYYTSYGLNLFTSEPSSIYNDDLSFVSSHIWDGALAETSHITSIGSIIYTAYPLWLILTSIILLLAMVGAIVITIKQ